MRLLPRLEDERKSCAIGGLGRLAACYLDSLATQQIPAIDLIDSGLFSHGDTELFRPLTDQLKGHDPFMLLADYASYVAAQREVSHAYMDPVHWDRMSILNTARMGKFSSDRSIRDYCESIWNIRPCAVDGENESRAGV